MQKFLMVLAIMPHASSPLVGISKNRKKKKKEKGFALTTCSAIEQEMGFLRQINRAK